MAVVYNNGVSASDVNVVNDVYAGIDAIFRSDIVLAEGRNTLDGFYKGEAENGKILEQMFIEMAEPYEFTRDDTQYLFKGNDAGINFKYFTDWNYEQSNKELFLYKIREMLANGKTEDEITAGVVASLRNGDNDKIYQSLKGLLLNAKSHMTAFVDNPTPATIQDLMLAIRDAISDFEFANNTYCAKKHATLKDNIRIIISAKLVNRIDVTYLANLLHVERAEMDALFWKVDTTDNVVYVVDKNALGYFTKNTEGYTEVLKPLRKMIFYYDNDKMYYYSDFFKATYMTYTPQTTETTETETQGN